MIGVSNGSNFTADYSGVVWSPWGGNSFSGGDDVQLPSSQASTPVNASSITKTFTFNGTPAPCYQHHQPCRRHTDSNDRRNPQH